MASTNISYLSTSIPSTFTSSIAVSNLPSTSSVYAGVNQASSSTANQLKSSANSIAQDQVTQQSKSFLSLSGDLAIVSGISFTLAQQLNNIATNDAKIANLVDQANQAIANIQTSQDIEKAKVLRSTALNAIADSESRISSLQSTFSTITTIVTVFNILVSTISTLPIPAAVPPGVGLPINIIINFADQLKKAKDIVAAFNVILAITDVILSEEINNLNNYRNQLNQIGNVTDDAMVSGSLSNDELNNLINPGISQLGTVQGVSYKGFTFAIKEENNSSFVVEGYKRHYAVALNSLGSIVITGQPSFTLDPNVLIQELELIIDRDGLTG